MRIVRSRRFRSALGSLAGVVVLAGWFVFLRPAALGGPAGYVLVRGVSMQPTYQGGDLVIVRPQRRYAAGDIVAYRVPAGEPGAGIQVIHRITGRMPDGRFNLLGDDNDAPDDWHPSETDVVGKAWLRIPKAGLLLAALHAPVPLASLGTGITVAIILVPGGRPDAGRRRRGGRTGISRSPSTLEGTPTV